MLTRRTAAALIFTSFIAACSGTTSTLNDSSESAARVYPVDEAIADRILASAMASEFPGRPVSPVAIPNAGYQYQIIFGLDSHNIAAYMIPAKGIREDGEIVNGYYFEVSHSGTMPFTGSNRSKSLFERIIANASAVAKPVNLASTGTD
ncbi:hypothetical protein [uncultured Roseovarius sp.]|uniref:hypothetical protein n=1 Tax=uncultured Roseovarius sp. TaxID=293344 RepID=UPI00259314F5|nr:hypothetical protein [uncultured Roseovarius sp.]